MSRILVAIAFTLLLAGCNSGNRAPAPAPAPVPVPPPVQVPAPQPAPAPAPAPIPAPPPAPAPAPVEPPKPEPMPAPEPAPAPVEPPKPVVDAGGPRSMAAFLDWATSCAQEVRLDGAIVKYGFGPAAQFFTQADGMISGTPRVIPPLDAAPEQEAPYVRPAVYSIQTLDPYVVGVSGVGAQAPKVTMEPGVIYAIPIVLPDYVGAQEWSMCEFAGEPAPHSANLSLVPGELERFTDYNLTPSIRIDVTADGPYKTGSTVYVNTCVSEPFPRAVNVHYDVLFRNA